MRITIQITIYVIIAIMSALLIADMYYVQNKHAVPLTDSEGAAIDLSNRTEIMAALQRLRTRGHMDKALLLLHDTQSYYGENNDFLAMRASVLLATDSIRLALLDADRILEVEPENAEFLELRARCFYADKQFAKSLIDVEKILAQNEADNATYGEVLMLKGLNQYAQEDYTAAAQTLTNCLGKAQDSIMVLYNRALCYVELEEFGKARADLLIVVEEAKGTRMAVVAQEALLAWKDE